MVCRSFLEQRDFDDPGFYDSINRKRLRISGTRRARSMLKDGAAIGTRAIKCKYMVRHYCFIAPLGSRPRGSTGDEMPRQGLHRRLMRVCMCVIVVSMRG